MKIRQTLNEAFSSSMPKWLKDEILRDRIKTDSSNDSMLRKYRDKEKYSDILRGGDPTYQSRQVKGTNYTPSYSAENLWRQFNDHKIDLLNANFINGDVPEKGSDARLKNEDNILIYHLVDDTTGEHAVYVPGFNDNRYWAPEDKYMKYMPVKTILSYTKDFCYLDGTDQSNYTDVKAIKASRRSEKNSIDRYNHRYTGDELIDVLPTVGNRYNRGKTGETIDKSGYITNPKKYEKALRDRHKLTLRNQLEDVYTRLKSIRKDYYAELMSSEIDDEINNNVSGIAEGISEIQREYNAGIIYIEDAISAEEIGNHNSSYWDYAEGEFKKAKRNLSSLESKLSNIITQQIDWDTPYEEEDE